MDTMKSIWDFFQNEILGMNWLKQIIKNLLKSFGLDTSSRTGNSILFFIYDTMKIMVLLGLVIAVTSGTVIEKLHLEHQIQDFNEADHALDVPQAPS